MEPRIPPSKQVTIPIGPIVEPKFFPRLTIELLRFLVQDEEARKIVVKNAADSTGLMVAAEFKHMRTQPQFGTAAIDGSLAKLQGQTFEYLAHLANSVAGVEVFPISNPDDNSKPVTDHA